VAEFAQDLDSVVTIEDLELAGLIRVRPDD
jgi:hypothetical protein